MKRPLKNSKKGALIMALLNLTNQTIINPTSKFNIDSLINDVLIGATLGGSIDLVSKSKEKSISHLSEKDKIWNKARKIFGKNSNFYRKDTFGNIIKYNDYGNRNSIYGWEKDHCFPKSLGGSDEISNLQPLQWWENVQKGNKYPYCP